MAGGMQPWVAALAAVGIVSLVSLIGAAALTLPGLRSHRFLLVLVAVAAGTLVGDAFFHLVPEAAHAWESTGLANMGLLVVGGFLLFFALEVVLRSRHAHLEMVDEAEHLHEHHRHGAQASPGAHAHAAKSPHAIQPAHDHAPDATPGPATVAPYAWTNLVGDAVHNFLDGAVIATAFLVDPAIGVATTIAVVVHEVPQELGDFAVLLRAGMKPARALLFNFSSALLAVLGAILVLALPVEVATIEFYGLPLIAGAFLYIAAADLIPELHHHSKGREAVTILLAFMAGLALMYGVLALEGTGFLAIGDAAHQH